MSHSIPDSAFTNSVEPLPKTIKQDRPNYNVLHALPLPLKTYPLPPLILHNPFSVFYFACSYIYQLIVPLSSHPKTGLKAYFSPESQSVHVTDQNVARTLWENGFFGKGNLSRSEPSWLDREMRRKGIILNETSEEVTQRRREERREFKKERARKERETIESALNEEKILNNADANMVPLKDVSKSCGDQLKTLGKSEDANDPLTYNGTLLDVPKPVHEVSFVTIDKRISSSTSGRNYAEVGNDQNISIKNQEHLQLTLEEAFFLVYGLGLLEIKNMESGKTMTTSTLLTLFRMNSYFPSHTSSDLRTDDPFLISYVVYHHFRSLGWVVRSGVKFAVDYLLYNRGPVFSHAEFAVIILPSYRHPYWRGNADRATDITKREGRSWWWLHCVNRVQSQVRKSLVLVYVEIPPPQPIVTEFCFEEHSQIDISELLKSYHVREMIVKRWIPNRSRD